MNLEELPLSKFKECHAQLLQAVAHYDCKNAEEGDDLYASDYGLTFRELEDIGSDHKSKGTFRSKRDE